MKEREVKLWNSSKCSFMTNCVIRFDDNFIQVNNFRIQHDDFFVGDAMIKLNINFPMEQNFKYIILSCYNVIMQFVVIPCTDKNFH